MNIREDISKRKEFWETQHRVINIKTLSGCTFDDTIDFLKVREYIKPNINVLEVGVGIGLVTKAFYDLCNVSALDISETALKRVSGSCVKTYSLDQIKELPTNYFDLIICHNLVQHIPTDLLVAEFTEIIRSLKKDGVFAVEFVSTRGVEDTGANVDYQGNDVGCYCRTPEWMAKFVKTLNAESKLVQDNSCNIGQVHGCHVIHINHV